MAVKQIYTDSLDAEVVSRVRREGEIMKDLNNPYIINYIGEEVAGEGELSAPSHPLLYLHSLFAGNIPLHTRNLPLS